MFAVTLIAFVFTSTLVIPTSGGSAEGDPAPPGGSPPGGGGGGGGSDVYYYFIPLVFNNSHVGGESKVVIWTIQPGTIQASFSIKKGGISALQLREPTKIELSPSTSPGLTNGSMIISSAPIQVTGLRDTQDIVSDYSFAYSVLPARMMGFEYTAPFDGYMTAFTRSANTQIQTDDGKFYFPEPFATITFEVKEGQYINSTQPISGVFYSSDKLGTSATLAVPHYLQGKEYLFNPKVTAITENEDDISFVKVIPEVPTEINLTYSSGKVSTVEIFGTTRFSLDDLNGISALRGRITVVLENVVSYSRITRRSTVEMIAAPEMRAGELFRLFDTFSVGYSFINPTTNVTVIKFRGGNYIEGVRELPVYQRYESILFGSVNEQSFVIANNSLFGIASSPGYVGHPMSPSMSFVPIPLNPQTLYRNVTGITSTWYRFTNLAVESIEIIPAPPEEFTGVTLIVTFVSNGSITAGNFKVKISYLGKTQVEESFDFLKVNGTLTYKFELFLDYGTEQLDVQAEIDIDDTVTEINEDDNTLYIAESVVTNYRIIVTFYLVIGLVVLYIVSKIVSIWRKRKRIEESRYDAILTIEESQEEI